jgi:NADP-dependent 3-hydroxy acid dehydrogenase YdfG
MSKEYIIYVYILAKIVAIATGASSGIGEATAIALVVSC